MELCYGLAIALVVGAYMDQSGRFDFWRVLVHTRAIIPPRGGWEDFGRTLRSNPGLAGGHLEPSLF
jgi:hypothetical protein